MKQIVTSGNPLKQIVTSDNPLKEILTSNDHQNKYLEVIIIIISLKQIVTRKYVHVIKNKISACDLPYSYFINRITTLFTYYYWNHS